MIWVSQLMCYIVHPTSQKSRFIIRRSYIKCKIQHKRWLCELIRRNSWNTNLFVSRTYQHYDVHLFCNLTNVYHYAIRKGNNCLPSRCVDFICWPSSDGVGSFMTMDIHCCPPLFYFWSKRKFLRWIGLSILTCICSWNFARISQWVWQVSSKLLCIPYDPRKIMRFPHYSFR